MKRQGDDKILELKRGSRCTSVEAPNVTGSYTLKWLSIRYMNFTSIKKMIGQNRNIIITIHDDLDILQILDKSI